MERIGYQSLVAGSYQPNDGGHDDAFPPSDHNLMVHVVPEHSKSKELSLLKIINQSCCQQFSKIQSHEIFSSEMESRRRPGLLLYQNILLSPEAWIYMHCVARLLRTSAVYFCSFFRHIPNRMR